MLINKILTCLLLLATTQLFAASNTEIVLGGRIHGKVTTSDNKPAEEVTVILKSGTKIRTTITNDNGLFEFTGLGQGNYQIEISGVGYETLNKDLLLQKASSLQVDFQLKIQTKTRNNSKRTSIKYTLSDGLLDNINAINIHTLTRGNGGKSPSRLSKPGIEYAFDSTAISRINGSCILLSECTK